jgi:predicted CopG family antitoxin
VAVEIRIDIDCYLYVAFGYFFDLFCRFKNSYFLIIPNVQFLSSEDAMPAMRKLKSKLPSSSARKLLMKAFTYLFMIDVHDKKTTITLRDDVYHLKEKAGARNISNQINKILIEYFIKKCSMFGVMKQTDLTDLRDHKDPCL